MPSGRVRRCARRDRITSTHRGHGHAIAKGVAVEPMMAELFGRESGSCRGKGGSMHIADFSVGMLGANGIVGGGFGIATGAALGLHMSGSDNVVLCFFGDSAHQPGRLAGERQLRRDPPTPGDLRLRGQRVRHVDAVGPRRPRSTSSPTGRSAFGFPGVTVDGMDAVATYEAISVAGRARPRGSGPTLVVAACHRFEGHSVGDAQDYRDGEEDAAWRERDPVAALRRRLVAAGTLDGSGRRRHRGRGIAAHRRRDRRRRRRSAA